MEVKEKRDFSQQLESFETDGYAIFRKVLDPQLVSEASAHIDWLLEKNPELRPEQLHHDLMTDDPFWVRLISDPRLLDIAEAFIGPNIALFASHYIAKPPLSGQSVLWHQDGSYWPLEPMEVVTLWLAVDDSDVENGCMRVIPGTQHERLLTEEELESHDDGTNVLGTGMHVDEIDEAKAVDIVLKAGDVSVHHPALIHGSEGNQSNRWRRGLTIRYIPTSTRILTDTWWPSAFMLRGKPVKGINRYRPYPKFAEGEHMPFDDADAWNVKSDDVNVRYGLDGS
ncbi:MAG: phytanoyl-CoA dioxygenase family protein [Rhodothermales bacterium]|jgi:ectoine hydroxylase-related dioxygenase (phytanoyl-CoA dioxygenase family)